jgi:hypothetical protein
MVISLARPRTARFSPPRPAVYRFRFLCYFRTDIYNLYTKSQLYIHLYTSYFLLFAARLKQLLALAADLLCTVHHGPAFESTKALSLLVLSIVVL